MSSGYITYYWQSSSLEILQGILFSASSDDDGNPIQVSKIENLGISQGDGVYGDINTFYTCARSEDMLEMQAGCDVADPAIITHLLGVWA